MKQLNLHVCLHFQPINGIVESAHFIQFSNLIKLLRIISPKNPLEIEKDYLSPSKSQIFSQLFRVAHSYNAFLLTCFQSS